MCQQVVYSMGAWTSFVMFFELQTFSSLLCVQSLRLQKYFELQEDRLKDLLRREKLWGKVKKEDELPKMAVSSDSRIS